MRCAVYGTSGTSTGIKEASQAIVGHRVTVLKSHGRDKVPYGIHIFFFF
jgi:hypothetical protein